MDAKRKRNREEERECIETGWRKGQRRLGINKDNHGIEEETEKENKANKMDRTKEWYSERKMTVGRNKKKEWMQRGGEEESHREKIGKGREERIIKAWEKYR